MRMPASNAHLSAYLRELYTERIAAESDPAKLDQLAEDADLDSKDKSNSSRSNLRSLPAGNGATPSRGGQQSVGTPGTRSRRAVDALVGPAPAPRAEQPHTRGTVSLAPPVAPPRRFPVVPVAIGGAVLLLAGAAAIVLLREEPPALPPLNPVVVVPTEKPAEPQDTVKPPPIEERKVEVTVTSRPEGASVQLEGQPLGVTPVKVPLMPDAPPVLMTVSMDGYEVATRKVSAADAPNVQVALERRSITGTKPPGKKGGGSLQIKTGR
jgi:hypothetical protein